MDVRLKNLLRYQFIESTVSTITEDGVASLLLDKDRDEKITTDEAISPVYPVINFGEGSIKKGDKVILFSAKSGVRKFYYLPKNLALAAIMQPDTENSDTNKLTFEEEGFAQLINGNNKITLNDGDYKDDLTLGDAILEGTLNTSYTNTDVKIFIPELEADTDYQRKALTIEPTLITQELLGSADERAETDSETKKIKSFNFVEEGSTQNYVIIESPFSIPLNTDKYTLAYQIFNEIITQSGKEKYLEIISDEGLGIFLNAVRENKSKLSLETPSNKLELQEGEYTEGFNNSPVRLDKRHMKVSLTNFKLDNVQDYDNKRPYEVSLKNYDYADPTLETDSRIRDQQLNIKTIKHRLSFVDTVGLANDFNSIDNEYIEYSSIGGNYFKFGSEKNNENVLDYINRAGTRMIQDSSHITTEQHKAYDFETGLPVNKDKEENLPINKIDFDKTKDAEKIVIENHSSENYETATNKMELSAAKDAQIKITNVWGDGKSNEITATKDLIEIKNADKKVFIKITSDSIKIEAQTEVNIKGKDVKVEGDVVLTGGSAKVGGTVTPTGRGALCGIPNCLLTGAPQTGEKSQGT